jgi:YVTN family beta-propeller protein
MLIRRIGLNAAAALLLLFTLGVAFNLASAQTATRKEPKTTGMLLVSLNVDRQVAVVDPLTLKVVAALPTPQGPHEITISRDGTSAYIADSGGPSGNRPGDSIVVLDLKTLSLKSTFKACERAHDIRVSRNGELLWVACSSMKAVLEMDAATGTINKSWDLGIDGGWFVEATPDDRKLYVPHLEGESLRVIDRKQGVVRTIISGTTQFGITISPNGKEVWASDADENRLAIIDTSNDRVIAKVSLGSVAKGGQSFSRMRFTPDGKQVVVVSGSKFVVVDAKRRSVSWSIEMPNEGKVVTVSADGSLAFVSHPEANRISIIDLLKRQITNSFLVGKQPDGVAFFTMPTAK